MKKFLRKWLGIENLESHIPKPVNQDELRMMIGEAFRDALSGKEDAPWCHILSVYHIPNTLEKALDAAARKTAGEVTKEWIAHRIETEAFIDEVVSRIQRKQLA